MRALALVLLLGAPADAALCGRVTFDGRPLPDGYAGLKSVVVAHGLVEPTLARVDGGRFCLADAKPGDYELQVSPPGSLFPPFALRAKGGKESLAPVSVSTGGRWKQAGPSGEIEVEVSLPATGPGWSVLNGTIRFPKEAGTDPALLFVRSESTATGTFQGTYHMAWVAPGPGAEGRFRLPVGPGRILNLWARAPGLGVESFRLPYGPGRVAAGPLHVVLGPAGAVSGSVFLPEGSAFKPYAGWEGKRRRMLTVRALGFRDDDDTADADFVDAEGGYRFLNLRPGPYRLVAVREGPRLPWAVPAPVWTWVAPGSATRLDLRLAVSAEVAMDPRGTYPAPVDSRPLPDVIPFWKAHDEELWTIGLPTATPRALLASSLLWHDDAPFGFLQDSNGEWRPRARDEATLTAAVGAGAYAVQMVRLRSKFGQSSARLLAASTARVAPGKSVSLRLPAPAPESGGTLTGEFPAACGPTSSGLRAASSLAGLHAAVAGVIVVTDARGALAGVAATEVSQGSLSDLVSAATAEDEPGFSELAGRLPRRVRLPGLPAGRYGVEAYAPACPGWRGEVVLEAGKEAFLGLIPGK